MGGISIWQLLIILAIIVLLFGTKRLRNIGGDVGSAVKGFKKSMQDSDDAKGDDEKSNSAEDEHLTDNDNSARSEEKSTSENDSSRK